MPVVAPLTLLHLRVALTRRVLGGAKCGNQYVTVLARRSRAFAASSSVVLGEDLPGQLVLLQQSAESKDRSLVGHRGIAVQARALAIQRYVGQYFYHFSQLMRSRLCRSFQRRHCASSSGRPPYIALTLTCLTSNFAAARQACGRSP